LNHFDQEELNTMKYKKIYDLKQGFETMKDKGGRPRKELYKQCIEGIVEANKNESFETLAKRFGMSRTTLWRRVKKWRRENT
jgi:transcriptional regulator of acetoin/glycerol metabolism